MIWNPGDGNDLNEGGDGVDTLQFNGSGGNEIMSASANGQRVTFLRNLANINMDVGTTENLVVFALGGDDALTAGPGLSGLIAVSYRRRRRSGHLQCAGLVDRDPRRRHRDRHAELRRARAGGIGRRLDRSRRQVRRA